MASNASAVDHTRAAAYAHAVNLSPADVPEMASGGREEEAKVKKIGVEGARCAGAASPYQRVVDLHSVKFKGATSSPQESLRSDVEVWPTSAVASRNSAAELSRRGRTCAKHLLERLVVGEIGPVHVSRLAVAWLPPPLPSAQASYEARVSLTISGPVGSGGQSGRSTATLESSSPSASRVQIPVYIDTLGFLVGPAHVGLTATSLKRPASSATEHRLLSVLYSRAKAHAL
jgi:hypothetical protein